MDVLSRTGVSVPKSDGSDSVTAFRLSARSLGNVFETSGALYAQGALADRPAAGKAGRLYKPSDVGLESVFYWDTGTAWLTVGAPDPVDPIASIPGLRTLGAGPQQAAPGNHTHDLHVFGWALPGAEVTGLTTVTTTVSAGPTTIVAGPASGRRVVKTLTFNAPTAGTSVTLTLAGVALMRLPFTTAGAGGEFPVTIPVAPGENLQATVTGGTVTVHAAYADRPDAAITRHGLIASASATATTVVSSSSSPRSVSQIWVANPSTSSSGTATVTFAGTALLSGTPMAAGSLLTLDLPRPLAAGQTVTLAGNGTTPITAMAVGY